MEENLEIKNEILESQYSGETEIFKPSIKLDLKIDVDKIKEFRRKNVKRLEEVLSFIYESFATSEVWAKLEPFQQYCLVEQVFLMYFATFASRIQCAAALAALEEDKYYTSKDIDGKMKIRSSIKELALNMKELAKKKGFTISQENAKSAKKLIEDGLNKKIIAILFGEELYQKITKKWGKFKLL